MLEVFQFEDKRVRTVTIENQPYFVGKDVAEALGYKKARNALSVHVDNEDKKGALIQGDLGGKQEMTVINESGMYSLILSSKIPNAKKFKRWVTSEVLPTIRKHGTYMTDEMLKKALTDPDTIIEIATQLKAEREGRLIAEQRVNEMQPKVSYYDQILSNDSLVTITQIAKDYGMSGRELNKVLHELKVQFKQGSTWLLYSKYQRNGWTHSETTLIYKADGTRKAVMSTKWTQKGRLGIYELLKAKGIIPLIEQEDDE